MTHFYGSNQKPRDLFPSPLILSQFYQAVDFVAPLCNQFRNYAIGTWNSEALKHSWVRPDGYDVVIPVLEKVEKHVEIPELGKRFTHYVTENIPLEHKVSNAANIIHSLDAMLVDEMDRACNYDLEKVLRTKEAIENCFNFIAVPQHRMERLANNTGYRSLRNIELIGEVGPWQFTEKFCTQVLADIEEILSYRSFPLLSNHDEFKCHANHCNRMRWWYRELLARFAEGNILEDIYLQLTGQELPIQKGNVQPDWIRQSTYTLS